MHVLAQTFNCLPMALNHFRQRRSLIIFRVDDSDASEIKGVQSGSNFSSMWFLIAMILACLHIVRICHARGI